MKELEWEMIGDKNLTNEYFLTQYRRDQLGDNKAW